MQRLCFFAVVTCVVMVSVAGQNCSDVTFNNATKAWNMDKYPDVGKNCTWTLNVTNTTQNALEFSGLNLNSSLLKLLVTTSDDKVIADLTDSKGIEVVVSMSSVTKIVLQRTNITENPVAFNISTSYDTKECAFTMTGSRGLIKSPLYGIYQPNKTILCSVDVTKLPDADLFVLSFVSFNITSGSLVVTLDGDSLNLNGTDLPNDILGTSTQNSFQLKLTINTNSSGQNVTLLYQTANSACSGAMTAIASAQQVVLPSAIQFPMQCYMQLKVNGSQAQVFTEIVGSGATQFGAFDSMVFYDGLSKRAAVLGSLNSAVRQFVSSSTGMTIVGELGLQPRGDNSISYRADAVSKAVTVTKAGFQVNIQASANQALLQFNGDGPMMRISVNGTLADPASVLNVQDSRGRTVYSFKAGMALFPVSVSDKTARVTGRLNGTDSLTVTATVVDADCNMVFSDVTGQVSVTGTPVPNKTDCSIGFVPAQSFLTQLSLTVNLCTSGTLTVYDGFTTGAKTLAVIKGSQNVQNVPEIWGPSGLRLVYADPNNCINQIVSASYQSLAADSACGSLSPSGHLKTPNNPNQYPLNANCNWAVPAKTSSTMYLMVNSPIQLQNSHYVSLVQNKTTTVTVFNANTSTLPADMVVPNVNLSVTFNSVPTGTDLEMSGSGADLTVREIDCGATVKNPSGNISNSGLNQTMECIWIIQVAPGNSTNPNIINASLSMIGNTSADNTLTVKDGGSARSSEILDKKVLSRTNFLWVRYTYTAKNSTRPLNFTLAYSTFTCVNVCNNSLCMHPDWRCNGKNDCGDWSDELNCTNPFPIPTPQPSPPAPHTDDEKKASAGWYIFCIVVGLLLGVMIVVFVPRCIRYVRGRQAGGRRTGYSNMSEDA